MAQNVETYPRAFLFLYSYHYVNLPFFQPMFLAYQSKEANKFKVKYHMLGHSNLRLNKLLLYVVFPEYCKIL